MAGGAVAPARLRIKGRKASVFRFFIISVAYTITWITLSSELGYYKHLYGPQVLLQMNIAYYLPSIPVLILSGHVEKIMDKRLGQCLSMFTRLIVGLVGCGFICAYFPFLPMSLVRLLGMVMLLGVTSAIAFSTSYQLVAWFRSADTISLGLGCVGSGPLVLIIQLSLGMAQQIKILKRWQWISMFEIGAAFVVCGICCTVSLMWQYANIISGREPYHERPLLADNYLPEEPEEEEEDEEGEPPQHLMSMMLSPRMLSLADPFQGMPLPTVTSSRRRTGHHHLAAPDQETGTLRPVRRAASMDSDYSLSTWQAQQQREWLRSKTINVAHSSRAFTHYISPPNSAKTTNPPPSDAGWDELPGSSNWSGFPSIASHIDTLNVPPPPSSDTPRSAAAAPAAGAGQQRPNFAFAPPSSSGNDLTDSTAPSSTTGDAAAAAAGSQAGAAVPLPNLAIAIARHRQQLLHEAGGLTDSSSDCPEDPVTPCAFPLAAAPRPSNLGPPGVTLAPRVEPEGRGLQPAGGSGGGRGGSSSGRGVFESGSGSGSVGRGGAASSRGGAAGAASPDSRYDEEDDDDSSGGSLFLAMLASNSRDDGASPVSTSDAGSSPFALVQKAPSQLPPGVPRLPPLPPPVGASPRRYPYAASGHVSPTGSSASPRPSDPLLRSLSPSEVQPAGSARLKTEQSEVQANLSVFKDLWGVILGSLASSTIVNLVFPFFTYIPTTPLLGDSLPQVLFFTRIFADILGRLLPRMKALTLTSPVAILVLAALQLCAAAGFFVYIKAPLCYQHDLAYLAIVTFFWVAGGYINTNSYILAPNLVEPRLCGRASAIMALTYQVAHFLGLVIAVVVMTKLFHGVGHI